MDNETLLRRMEAFDPELSDLLLSALDRQCSTLSLIPTANAVSPFSAYLKGSVLGNDFMDHHAKCKHQWIIEFARILVVIAKELRVRMLLTSHNPDMVAALQKIADVEGLDGLRYYMAKPVNGSNGYKYMYEDLGKNIEPVFDMFNIAMDRIDAYGNV